MGEKITEKIGEYEIQDILKPYYHDVNYASDPSDTNSKKIRKKNPAQLLGKYDPLPSEKIQQKIDFFFKPYYVRQQTKKSMSFYYDEREELMEELTKRLQKPELSKEDQYAFLNLLEDIKAHKIEFEDNEDENALKALTNFIFDENNERKRNLVLQQLSSFFDQRSRLRNIDQLLRLGHLKHKQNHKINLKR